VNSAEETTLQLLPASETDLSDFVEYSTIVGDYATDSGIIDRYIHEPR